MQINKHGLKTLEFNKNEIQSHKEIPFQNSGISVLKLVFALKILTSVSPLVVKYSIEIAEFKIIRVWAAQAWVCTSLHNG